MASEGTYPCLSNFRNKGHAMHDELQAKYIAGLIHERDSYIAQKNSAAAAEVSAELARIGAETPTPVKRASKRPAGQKASSVEER